MKLREWYRIDAKAAKDSGVVDVYIYDQIGKSFYDDAAVTAAKFVDELKALPESVKTVRVHVNSPGGNVFEASAIANALRSQQSDHGRTVEVRIDGLAASAATIITSAGKPILIAENAMVMVHEPSAAVMGPASSLRKLADALDNVKASIIAAYRWVSKKSTDELSAMMAAVTWMTAAQAVENGFATEVVTGGSSVTACFEPSALSSLGEIPPEFRARVEALLKTPTDPPVAANALDVVRECKAAGFPSLAEELLSASATLDQVKARLTTEKDLRAAAQAREHEITAICATAKVPQLAAHLFTSGMSIADVRAHVVEVTAAIDKVEIDTGLKPDAKGTTAVISTTEVYATRNVQKE